MTDDAAPRRILIQAPSWIGDLVMATSSFADIRGAFPGAHIAILVKPGRDGVLAGCDFADEVIVQRSPRGPRSLLGEASALRRGRFDLAVLFSDSFRSAALIRLAGVTRRVGYARNLRTPLLTTAVRYPGPGGAKTPEPMPIRYARLLEAIGVPPGDGRPRLAVTPEEKERVARRRAELGVGADERLIGLNPGASYGSSKIWPPEHFARLGDLLFERTGLRSIILVGPGEEAIADAMERRMKHRPISTARSIVPLDELKPLVRDLALLVTTDTGPRQYAVAFRVPIVVVMGPTDPRYSNANLDETIILRRDELDCIACHHKTCPIDHRCMRWITPDDVMAAVDELDRKLNLTVFRERAPA